MTTVFINCYYTESSAKVDSRNYSYLVNKAVYDKHTLHYVTLWYDGKQDIIQGSKIEEILKYLTKEYILVSSEGYFNFNLIAHHLAKKNMQFEISNAAGSVCLRSLAGTLGIHMNKYPSPSDMFKLFEDCKSHPKFIVDPLMSNFSDHWVERVVNIKDNAMPCKWIMFAQNSKLNELWNLVIEHQNLLNYASARVSTSAVNIWAGKPVKGVVQLTYNLPSEAAAAKPVIEQLMKKKFTVLRYKPN